MNALHSLLIVLSTGLAFNLISMVYILKTRRCSSTGHISYLNLAFADLMFTIVGIRYFSKLLKYGASLDDEMKHVITSEYYNNNKMLSLCYMIVANTVAISLFPLIYDRIIAVIKPMIYGTSKHRNCIIISTSLCWIISATIHSLIFHFLGI